MKRLLSYPLLIWAVLMTVGLSSCHNDSKSNVPDYPVCLDIQITKEHPGFVPEGGFNTLTFTKAEKAGEYVGYAGVVVWVNALNEYRAADLACPNCVKKDKPVVVDGIFATCPLCGEVYELSQYGFPQKGIANQPLRSYSTRTVYEGPYRVLRVRN